MDANIKLCKLIEPTEDFINQSITSKDWYIDMINDEMFVGDQLMGHWYFLELEKLEHYGNVEFLSRYRKKYLSRHIAEGNYFSVINFLISRGWTEEELLGRRAYNDLEMSVEGLGKEDIVDHILGIEGFEDITRDDINFLSDKDSSEDPYWRYILTRTKGSSPWRTIKVEAYVFTKSEYDKLLIDYPESRYVRGMFYNVSSSYGYLSDYDLEEIRELDIDKIYHTEEDLKLLQGHIQRFVDKNPEYEEYFSKLLSLEEIPEGCFIKT